MAHPVTYRVLRQFSGREDEPWLERARQDIARARREIRQGRFQRSMAVVTGVSAIVSGFETYVQHRRGAFSHWLMWTPVWLTPPMALAAVAAVVSERAARRLLPAISVVSLADGVIGFGYHIRGIRNLPGGFRLGRYNIEMGPPVFAPLLTCTVGVTGLLTGLLRREPPPLSRTATRRLERLMHARRLATYGRHSQARRAAPASLQRGLAVTTALFAALAGGEAWFEHLRGSFNNPLMWTPVLVAPPMALAALGAATSTRVADRLLPVASAITFLDGLLGFGLHLRGLKRMPGGASNLPFKLMQGPPAFAPLLFSSVGMLGLIAALLRRSKY
jgi:hypothetical protein